MKTLREKLAAVLAEAKSIADLAKSEDREFTADEITKIGELKSQADELNVQVKAADDAQSNMKTLLASTSPAKSDEEPKQADEQPEGFKSFGEAYTDSAPYQELIKSNPGGFGEGSLIQLPKVTVGAKGRGLKADPNPLSVAVGRLQPTRLPQVDLTYQRPLTLLDLISTGSITGNSFDYVQITSVLRNAGIVKDEILPGDPASALKPLSDLSTNLATGKVFTYADGYTVTSELLADAGAFASYLNGQLAYNIRAVIENYLVNGTGASGQPTGILNTTGIQQIATAGTDPVQIPTSIRKALTALDEVGAQVTGIVLNPADAEVLDLMQDGNQRFFGAGPFGAGPRTLWGRPYVTTQAIPEGTALVGDLSTINVLEREALSVVAFNQHADYARRNLVYVRAELRAAQVIYKPAHLALVDLGTTGA
ncbi:HK97 family phage major capsid protein [Curtobacterium sp. PhB172]|uniref:phage major capsid protein n=1 Tax=Curtobacterium sp. PhB172 TaxID=2485196 RepID=UPI000F4CE337|nr:phage major capsid protein [Curtobacterium sp. PhB172]ROS63904.1 HK97 family phage major capsid protein [Curtobacterium sp. PhB172]